MVIRGYSRVHIIILLLLAGCFPLFGQDGSPQPRKFDEFSGDAQSEDLKARLDNFAIELRNQPDARGYIIVYGSRRVPPGVRYRYAERAGNFLVEVRGLDSNRIVAVDGGASDCFQYELWLVPAGASQPERRYTYDTREDSDVAYLFDLLETWSNDDVEVLPDAHANEWHLSAFAAELKKNPKSRGYIIAYPQYCSNCRYDGHRAIVLRDSAGTIQNILRAKKNYLIREQGISPSRIVTVNGGHRKWREIELWVVPPGGHAPVPRPNQFPALGNKR